MTKPVVKAPEEYSPLTIASPVLTGSAEAGHFRIPSLDGIRAFSIGLVLLSHLDGTRGFPGWLSPVEDLGNLGVRIFFVISGFLITTLLLQELSVQGRISLKHFYIRRLFRIFPACYSFLIVIALLNYAGYITLLPHDLWSGFSYTMNYHAQHSWYTGHLWSLSVEEQFYLLWPAILRFTGVRGGMLAALFMLAAAPLVRISMLVFLPSSKPLIGTAFPTIADAIAVGCIVAFIGKDLSRNARYRSFLKSKMFFLVPATILLLNYPLFTVFSMLVEQSLLNVAIALCIHRWVLIPEGIIGRILNSSVVTAIGVLSYSLYLWQQLFLNRHSTGAMSAFPINVLLAFGAATISYRLIERPFLRLKRRLEENRGTEGAGKREVLERAGT